MQYTMTGSPVAGTTEVWTLTLGGTPTGGTFTLKYGGWTTGAITWSATNGTLIANIDAALEALGAIGTGGVTTAALSLTAGIGTITITAAGNNAKIALPYAFTTGTNSLTGTSPTVAIAESTPGVNVTLHGAPPGATVQSDDGFLYINTGTAASPTWTKVGTQT